MHSRINRNHTFALRDDRKHSKNITKLMKQDEYTAVHCRIPTEVWDEMQSIRDVTEKSIASYVSSAIIMYGKAIKENNPTAIDALELDRLAYKLSKKMKDNLVIKLNNSEDYQTSFEGSIDGVEVNGEKLMGIHNLTKAYRLMAVILGINVVMLAGLASILFNQVPDIDKVNKALDNINDTGARVRYMIEVRPGLREASPYSDYTLAGYGD